MTGVTRRHILPLIPGALTPLVAAAGDSNKWYPQASELVRFSDPTTEIPVVRLTNPVHTSILPARGNRLVSTRQRTLLFSSDRGGAMAPYQMDLRSGIVRQVAEAAALHPASLCLDASARFAYLLDGDILQEVELSTRRTPKTPTPMARGISDFALGYSRSELFVIRRGKLEQLMGERGTTLAEDAAGPCSARPGGKGCLFTRPDAAAGEGQIWYADNGSRKSIRIASGRVSDPCWSADGQSVFYLRQIPKNEVYLSEIYQFLPEQGVERCVARTSQFASFSPNGDDTVFVGASRSRAQPNVILLLRAPARELTLCEHHASRAEDVRPVFSPDSKRIYFESNREGKSALYSVNVEALVEPTQADG